jgi:hypothetical protein
VAGSATVDDKKRLRGLGRESGSVE